MSERLCLIVDDESEVRKLLSTVVERKGFQSLEAENASEALQILQRLDGQIDLLITDIQMPGEMGGLDLACAVKKSFSSLPVILVSGNYAAPTGFTFVRKPFMPDAILNAIDQTMRKTGATGQNQER